MRKPVYNPNLAQEDYSLVWNYGGCNSTVYCFMRDLMKRIGMTGTPEQEDDTAFFLMAVYGVGRIQGIREERWSRRLKKDHTEQVQPITEPKDRAELMQEITRRLESADYRKLRLVWVYASHLIG